MILNEFISSEILKTLSLGEKKQLANEIRTFLIESVSKTGGHLSSNLGTVELIISMHSVFSTPKDKFIFDVGHQSYTHKILTGRMKKFNVLRCAGGISGFPRPSESEHDAFIGGHSSISISAAVGFSEALNLDKDNKSSVVVVVGDGAMTGGGVYEGLNNINKKHKNLIIILNDNGMSISKSSGSVSSYLSQIRSTKKYYQTKLKVKDILDKSTLGQDISHSVSATKKIIRNVVIKNNMFENLGVKYYGPIDGHDIKELIQILEFAKTIDEPCLIHVKTKKGKGFIPAEENAGHYHGIDGNKKIVYKKPSASEIFGKEILMHGEKDKRICFITAAMKYATGGNFFSKKFPERFFDVGIAEGHGITFSSALSAMGKIPVFAVYSTFIQRGFDQIIHDAAIEKQHIILGIDRAGLTGEDGETHLGIFDVPMLRVVPNTVIFSPAYCDELKECLKSAIYKEKGVVAVRYPRGSLVELGEGLDNKETDFRIIKSGGKNLIITYGRISVMLKNFLLYGYDLLQLIKIHPITEVVIELIKEYENIIFIEESTEKGGIAESFAIRLLSDGWKGNFKYRGINGFVPFADVDTQAQKCGLDYNSLKEFILR